MSLMSQLLDPRFTSNDPRVNLRQLNRNANEYEAKAGERISDLMTHLCQQKENFWRCDNI